MAEETQATDVATESGNSANRTATGVSSTGNAAVVTTRKVRAGVAEGATVGVTIQLPKDLYAQIEQQAKADERSVPHFLLRQIREQYVVKAATPNSIA